MKCHDCGGDVSTRQGTLRERSEFVGAFDVDDVQWEECAKCGGRTYPYATVKAIEAKRRETIEDALFRRHRDLVDERDAAEVLGISFQAVNRYKSRLRNLVWSCEFNGHLYFLRQSAEQYRATGTGLFPLTETMRTGGGSSAMHSVDRQPRMTVCAPARVPMPNCQEYAHA